MQALVRAFAVAGLAGLVSGCELPEPRHASLPDWIGVVVEFDDGGRASLLVELAGPRRPPILRVAEGVFFFDGERLLEVRGGALASAELDPPIGGLLEIRDLLGTQEPDLIRFDHDSDRRGRLLGIDVGELELDLRPDGSQGRWRYDLESKKGLAVEAAPKATRFRHFGPSRGFEVKIDEAGTVLLRLPTSGEGQGVPLMSEASRILGVSWVADSAVDPEERETLDEVYKEVGTLFAEARSCAADGDLSEWADQVAMGVDDRAQVGSGEQFWLGDRDASFAVATRLNETRLCWAVRLRDDAVLANEDQIEIVMANQRHVLPIPEGAQGGTSGTLTYAFTDSVAFGVAVEGVFPLESVHTAGDFIPFRVIYTDADPEEATATTLATAPPLPWPALAGIKKPRLLRDEERSRP